MIRRYADIGLLTALGGVFVGSFIDTGSKPTDHVTDAIAPVIQAASVAAALGTTGTETEKAPPRGGMGAYAAVHTALEALASSVRPLSHPKALDDAFASYFAFKTLHPEKVRKPLLYFVDYGLPSTEKRGYVFDMETLKIVDGPFMVAHGRGSASPQETVPRRFSNMPNSYATSLGLYLAQETYGFNGKSGGRRYRSVGLKLEGVSGNFNDNARARKVVAHGAPYVTPTRAGRSEGCPAMEQERARELLPKLAEGGLVFLFAPNEEWLARDPWVNAGMELAGSGAQAGL